MIKTYMLNLGSLEKVKDFCNFTPKLDGEIDIHSEGYIVDGKSILGLLSLDLTKPLKAVVKSSEEELKIFENQVRERNWAL